MKAIIGVDPSLRGTGYAVIAAEGGRVRSLEYGVISNPPAFSHAACLLAIHERLLAAMEAFSPVAMAIESTIYVQSYKTAIVLGAARGAALLAAAKRGLPVHEYAPRRIKQAVVGRGGAQKQQVSFMIRALFGLSETPSADAADALAVALTHAQAEGKPVFAR